MRVHYVLVTWFTYLQCKAKSLLKMKIIGKETLQFFIVQGATIVLGTIFTCYGLAASLGHVPVWLPMISDCAVYAPEKYLFRLGLVTGSIFLHIESILLYNADKAFSNSRLSMILSLMSSLGMGIVAVVNEKENNTVHTGTCAKCVTIFVYCIFAIQLQLLWHSDFIVSTWLWWLIIQLLSQQ